MGALGKQGDQPEGTVSTCYCGVGPGGVSHRQSMFLGVPVLPIIRETMLSSCPQLSADAQGLAQDLAQDCSHLKISPGPCYHSAIPHPSATELLEVLV